MPYKDSDKQRKYEIRHHAEKYHSVRLSIRNDSGIPEALFKMQDRTGIAPSTYAQIALREKLIAEGYMREDNPAE